MTYLELIRLYDLEEIWGAMMLRPTVKRLVHIAGVIETAYELAQIYGADSRNAVVAAVFHDWYRGGEERELNKLIGVYGLDEYYKGKANLSHGLLAAELMRERYGVADEDLLNAVRYHTTGRAGMSLLEKIMFMADVIEPSRVYEGVDELRRLAFEDLDAAMIRALRATIDYVRMKGESLDDSTLQAYNFLVPYGQTTQLNNKNSGV